METNIRAMKAINNLTKVREKTEDVGYRKKITNLVVTGFILGAGASCILAKDFSHVAGFFGGASVLTGCYSALLTKNSEKLKKLDRRYTIEIFKSIRPVVLEKKLETNDR